MKLVTHETSLKSNKFKTLVTFYLVYLQRLVNSLVQRQIPDQHRIVLLIVEVEQLRFLHLEFRVNVKAYSKILEWPVALQYILCLEESKVLRFFFPG